MAHAKLVPVAASSHFALLERPDAAYGEWRTIKLVRLDGGPDLPKRNWWFGWNGERLSRSRDAGLLLEYQPDTYDWVIAALRAHDHAEGEPDNVQNVQRNVQRTDINV